jgi:hypothetical protein
MAWEPDFETYANTRLFICAARPADNTETLWEGVTTWHEITITSVANIHGRTYNSATLAVVSNAHDRNKKGSYTLDNAEFGVQWLPAEQGQIIAQAASLNYTIPGFAVVYQGGEVSYFSAQVAGLTEAGGASNDARTGTLTLMRQSDTVDAATPVIPTEATP